MSEIRLHSDESEQAILGALLIDPSACDRLGALRPDHFYSEAHRIILAEIMAMRSVNQDINPITVAESLHERGLIEQVGELAYLGDLVANSLGSRSIGRYAETVISKALERQLLAASETIRETVCGIGTTKEKLTTAQSAVMSISEAVASRTPRTMREVLLSAAEVLDQRSNGVIKCLPSGFVDLDKQLAGGFRPGNLVIIAGRPGMGKTALAVNVALQAANHGSNTLFLSLEMPEQELADRLVSQAGSVCLSDVLAGNMEDEPGERIMCAMAKLQDVPLVIDDQGALSLFDVASKARSTRRKHGLDLLVIDYLQLMTGDGDNRNQQIEQITRGLKALAKELDIPVIVLSQLSRKCEERTNKRPMPSDLRESGAIEQDADVILFVYRDEEYHPNSPEKGTAEIIVGKNRQGQSGMVRLAYQGCYTRFNDLDHSWQPEQKADSQPVRKRGLSGF